MLQDRAGRMQLSNYHLCNSITNPVTNAVVCVPACSSSYVVEYPDIKILVIIIIMVSSETFVPPFPGKNSVLLLALARVSIPDAHASQWSCLVLPNL